MAIPQQPPGRELPHPDEPGMPAPPEIPDEIPPGREPDWRPPGTEEPPLRVPDDEPDVETEITEI